MKKKMTMAEKRKDSVYKIHAAYHPSELSPSVDTYTPIVHIKITQYPVLRMADKTLVYADGREKKIPRATLGVSIEGEFYTSRNIFLLNPTKKDILIHITKVKQAILQYLDAKILFLTAVHEEFAVIEAEQVYHDFISH